MELDRIRFEEDEDDTLVFFHCLECGAEYELGFADLLAIQQDGHVECECGHYIDCSGALSLFEFV